MFSRMDILGFWQKAQITPARLSIVKSNADKIVSFKSGFYDEIQASTGVPWYVLGAIDMREEDYNHKGYLGNGDPLSRKTTHVPRGRGPFKSWADGAIDSIHTSGWDRLPTGGHWDVVTALMKMEVYNGAGYGHMGLRSPYVWAATNMQQSGKYTADGHFDAHAWDNQLGCASVLLALKQFHGVDLQEA